MLLPATRKPEAADHEAAAYPSDIVAEWEEAIRGPGQRAAFQSTLHGLVGLSLAPGMDGARTRISVRQGNRTLALRAAPLAYCSVKR